MNRINQLVLGLLSLGPILFFGAFFLWLVPEFPTANETGRASPFRQRFDILVPIAIATSALLIALFLFYTVLLARRPELCVAEKVGVPLCILISNGIVLPLVWWLYVWKRLHLGALSPPPADRPASK